MVAPLRWLPRVAKTIPVTLHHDHLGSINTITDADRNIIEQRSFDAFGRVRQADWGNTLALLSSPITRGYTGHENIGLGLVHMNGRVYDPDLGRFLSPDPYIQAPKNLQSYNRYAYVINNPLSYTDPSGYFFKKARKKLRGAVKGIRKAVSSAQQNQYVRMGLSIAAAYYTGGAIMSGYSNAIGNAAVMGTGSLSISATTASVLAGAAGGFAGGLVASGGDLRAGITGAFVGGCSRVT